jgi:hypothetical protein
MGNALATAVLAVTLLPASAMATANYDVFGFAALDVVTSSAVIPLGGSVDQLDTFTDTDKNAAATIVSDTALAGDDFILQDLAILGDAHPTGGTGSYSFSSIESTATVAYINTSNVAEALTINFDYFVGAFTAVNDVVNEIVGATVNIFLGTTDFAGNDVTLVDEVINLADVGSGDLFDSVQQQVSVAGGSLFGIESYIYIDGFAAAVRQNNQIPLPATLTLMALGLVGLAMRRRASATNV